MGYTIIVILCAVKAAGRLNGRQGEEYRERWYGPQHAPHMPVAEQCLRVIVLIVITYTYTFEVHTGIKFLMNMYARACLCVVSDFIANCFAQVNVLISPSRKHTTIASRRRRRRPIRSRISVPVYYRQIIVVPPNRLQDKIEHITLTLAGNALRREQSHRIITDICRGIINKNCQRLNVLKCATYRLVRFVAYLDMASRVGGLRHPNGSIMYIRDKKYLRQTVLSELNRTAVGPHLLFIHVTLLIFDIMTR